MTGHERCLHTNGSAREIVAQEWHRQIINAGGDENVALQAVTLAALNGLFDYVVDAPAVTTGEPAGWKLVPMIPTARMVEIGCENNPTMWNDGTPDGFAADVANDIYVSMVRAALSQAPATDAAPIQCDGLMTCAAAKFDGVICADDTCDFDTGVRKPPVGGQHD